LHGPYRREMMRSILLACLSALAAGCVSAAEAPCPAGDEWAAGGFENSGAMRQVKPQYRNRLAAKKSGITVITIAEPREVVAVDRQGVVVIPGIFHTGDFDYPTAVQGVGRFRLVGKCGYFNTTTFRTLVSAEYAQCQPFHAGEALACKDCERYCTEVDCQNSTVVGGQGFVFDAKGKMRRKFALPKLEDACGRAGVAQVTREGRATPYLRCKEDPDSPFKL